MTSGGSDAGASESVLQSRLEFPRLRNSAGGVSERRQAAPQDPLAPGPGQARPMPSSLVRASPAVAAGRFPALAALCRDRPTQTGGADVSLINGLQRRPRPRRRTLPTRWSAVGLPRRISAAGACSSRRFGRARCRAYGLQRHAPHRARNPGRGPASASRVVCATTRTRLSAHTLLDYASRVLAAAGTQGNRRRRDN